MRGAPLLIGLVVLTPAPLGAQWRLGVEAGAAAFAGASHATTRADSGGPIRPHGTATVAIRLERLGRQVGFGLAVLHASPGIGEESNGLAIVATQLLGLTEIAPEVTVRAARSPAGAVFRVAAGPIWSRWRPRGESARTRWGAGLALELDLPFAARVTVAIRAGALLSASPFESRDLPPRLAPQTALRRSVAGGLRVRL